MNIIREFLSSLNNEDAIKKANERINIKFSKFKENCKHQIDNEFGAQHCIRDSSIIECSLNNCKTFHPALVSLGGD